MPVDFQENDVIHTMQMCALASAYFRLYKPKNLNCQRTFEMILIHEFGEILAGDILEGSKEHESKSEIEERCIREIFGPLQCGQYFISLWCDFEYKKSNEAKFVYQLDKLDPILKAKFIDNELSQDKLFSDFYGFEEKRRTFEDGCFAPVFQFLNRN